MFKYKESYVNKNGVRVDKYVPTKDLYVYGCDISLPLQMKKCKINELTVHKYTQLWEIRIPSINKSIKVSQEHSLILENDNKLEKVSPKDILSGKYSDYNIIIFENNCVTKIPVKDATINKISDKEITYDFSLEGGNAFIANDILVMDTVSVFMPQIEESQNELKQIVRSHTILPTDGTFKYKPKWDSVYGIYILTKEHSTSPFTARKDQSILTNYQQLKKYILTNPDKIYHYVNITLKNTKLTITLGRLLFNLLLPQTYQDIHNEPIDKNKLQQILDTISFQEYSKFNDNSNTILIYDEICKLGNIITTIYPTRYDLFSLDNISKKVETILAKLDKLDILNGIKTINDATNTVKKYIEKENKELFDIIESGTVSSWNDIQQLIIAKGYVIDLESKIINEPIKTPLLKGLSNDEFFTSAYSNRKGIIDRALNTAEPGYLLRQLSIANSYIVLSNSKDCGTKKGLTVTITENNYKKFLHRYTLNGDLITSKNISTYLNKTIEIRSPLFCLDKTGICKKCYGNLSNYLDSKYIGVIASQAIGEKLQQNMLKTFHVTSVGDRLKEVPTVITNDTTLIKQENNKLKVSSKDNLLKIILTPNDCEYKIVVSNVIIYSGNIRIIGTNKNELITLNHPFAYIELYPDTINRNSDLSSIIGDEEENAVVLTFNKKHDYIGEVSIKIEDVSSTIKIIRNMFNARITVTDPTLIFNEMFTIIDKYSISSVHLEVILSNMLRVKDEQDLLWRQHQDKELSLTSIKEIIQKDSHIVFVSFEDIGKALTSSISNARGENKYSILETIIDGDLTNI